MAAVVIDGFDCLGEFYECLLDEERNVTQTVECVVRGEGGEHMCQLFITLVYWLKDSGEKGEIAIDVQWETEPRKQVADLHWWRTVRGGIALPICDFQLSRKGTGVGTVIWHLLYKLLPDAVRLNAIVSGKLVQEDSAPARDRLWRRLIQCDSGSIGVFRVDEVGIGRFKGRLHDVGLPRHVDLIVERVKNVAALV